MATKALTLEELKGTTVADLFAYSGSKVIDLKDWINQQWEEVGKFPFDTFHKQGYVVQAMVEVFSKTEKKEKMKALCGLAGRLWFAHRLLSEQDETLKQELAALTAKLAGVEEELLTALTEKNVLNQKLLQAQDKHASGEVVSSESEDRGEGGDIETKMQQLISKLKHAKQELKLCHEQIDDMKVITNGHVNSLSELQTQAYEHRRRSEGYQQKIQELEMARTRSRSQNSIDCDGSCRDKIRQLEADRMKACQEIDLLKLDIEEARNRYWEIENLTRDRERSLENKDNKITRLEKEKETLKKQIEESRWETRELQNLLFKEGRRAISRRPSITETTKPLYEADSADLGDSMGSGGEDNVTSRIRKGSYSNDQGRRRYTRSEPYSDEGSDSEWTEVRKRRPKNKKNERSHHEKAVIKLPPNGNAKSIKTIREMLPLFSKNNKGGSIQDHLSLYQRLMQTLNMDSDLELRTYLSWTFAADSQSFFMCVDNKDYKTWAEYRCEVIRHFSPHRNAHEALRHALNLKCESNQHPRDYLQLLKNAFAQVQKEVDTETKQFKDAFFYGLPKQIRTQLARDYNESRNIDWIYKQAKSIYDVSRTEENTEGKDKPKPSKICEIVKEKELPFETGGNKPRPAQKGKEGRNSPDGKRREGSGREPEPKSAISPRYKGNNPIPNFVYRPKESNTETRSGGDREREKPRETGRSEREQYSPAERGRNSQNNYKPRSYDQSDSRQYRRDNRDSREWQEQRNYSDSRDRFARGDERPRSPWRPNCITALEEQLKDLSQNFQKLLTQGIGSSPRANVASASVPDNRESTRTGQ